MNIPTQITDNVDTATKTYVDINDRVLDTVVKVNRRIVDTVVEIADRVPANNVDVPFVDRIPTPAETGDRYLDFVERATTMNRDFTARVVKQLPTTATAKTTTTATSKAAAKKTKAAPKRTAKARK